MLDRLTALFVRILPRSFRRMSYDPAEAEAQYRRLRFATGALIILLPLALVLALAARPVTRAVRSWHARGLAGEAMQALAARDWKTAQTRTSAALALAPAEPLAAEAEAHLLSRFAPARAPEAWEALCKRFPANSNFLLEHSLVLLRAERRAEAVAVFERCSPAARSTARGQLLQGLFAVAASDPKHATAAFREALRVDPTEPECRWQLSRLLLAGNSAAVREGIDLLETLRAERDYERSARQLLFAAHRRAGDLEKARREAEALAESWDTGIEDLVRLSDLLREIGDRTARARVQKRIDEMVARDPAALPPLLQRLAANPATRVEALVVGDMLPPAVQNSKALTPILAGMWDTAPDRLVQFRELIRAGDWSGAEIEADAFRARLASRDGNARLQAEMWTRAVRRAGDVPEQLGVLLGLARRWQWQSEQLPLLARLAYRRPSDRALLESWRRAGIAARQSEAVQRACAALLTAGVDTPDVRNDFAASALLRRTDLERATQLALSNYTSTPKNGDYTATYATALRVAGRAADGLRILDALPPTERIREPVELERAACLAALGRREEARAIALRLSQGLWFPEEESMLIQLRTGD